MVDCTSSRNGAKPGLIRLRCSKPPVKTVKAEKIQKLAAAFVFSIVKVVNQVSDADIHTLALGESIKLLPYVVHQRKAMKLYLKVRVPFALE